MRSCTGLVLATALTALQPGRVAAKTADPALPTRPALTTPGDAASSAPSAPVTVAKLHVVLLNGGASPDQNFSSHLSHLRQFSELALAAGIPHKRITIFSSDGDDPAPDLLVAGKDPIPGEWLLDFTPEGEYLAPTISLANSELPGFSVQPATKRALRTWFRQARKSVKIGDTILLFVTDHGTNASTNAANNPSGNAVDPQASSITLWGREELSVRELRALLETLDPGVRVVTVMSQCFSGGFAHLLETHGRPGTPTGAACGYFSSTADRPAYGCYAETAGAEQIGHAFEFLRALGKSGNLADAHRSTLELDDTPDVPLRSSDVYLDEILHADAVKAATEPDAYRDAILASALRDRKVWEPEIRLLDRLGEAYGLFSPRSFREIADVQQQIHDVLEQIAEHAKAWNESHGDLTHGNLRDFVTRNSAWRSRLQPDQIHGLPLPARRALAHDLLEQLRPFSEKKTRFLERLHRVQDREDAIDALAYRMEVRLAALLRMQTVLGHIVGVTHLAQDGTAKQKDGFRALSRCEDLGLPGPVPALAKKPAQPDPPEKDKPRFANLAEDMVKLKSLVPAGLGIVFRPVPDALRIRHKLRDGASVIQRVMPATPAESAGLQVGDIVIGEPDQPFTQPNHVRAWTMLSPIDTPLPLEILRGESEKTIEVVLRPRPTRWPNLPARPALGSLAPPLDGLKKARGREPQEIGAGGPYVLFFWATWCGPCKQAVPELLDFSKRRNIPIIAVTDEDEETLKTFLSRFEKPFPANVVTNELRTLLSAYGVSATPTFVLVGADGTIQDQTTGYNPTRGLGFRNWRWREN